MAAVELIIIWEWDWFCITMWQHLVETIQITFSLGCSTMYVKWTTQIMMDSIYWLDRIIGMTHTHTHSTWAHQGFRWYVGYVVWSRGCNRLRPPPAPLSSAAVWVAGAVDPIADWTGHSGWSLLRWTELYCPHPCRNTIHMSITQSIGLAEVDFQELL